MISSDNFTSKSLFTCNENEKKALITASQEAASAIHFFGRIVHVISQDFYSLSRVEELSSAEISLHILQAFKKGLIIIEDTPASGKIRIFSAVSSTVEKDHIIQELFNKRCAKKNEAAGLAETSLENVLIEEIADNELDEIEEEISLSVLSEKKSSRNERKYFDTSSTSSPSSHHGEKKKRSNPIDLQSFYNNANKDLSSLSAKIAKDFSEAQKQERTRRKEDQEQIDQASTIRKEAIRKEEIKREIQKQNTRLFS